eukprot:94362_1
MLVIFCLSFLTATFANLLKCQDYECGSNSRLTTECGVCKPPDELLEADAARHCRLAFGLHDSAFISVERETGPAELCDNEYNSFICRVTIECTKAQQQFSNPLGYKIALQPSAQSYRLLKIGKEYQGKVSNWKRGEDFIVEDANTHKTSRKPTISQWGFKGKPEWHQLEDRRQGMAISDLQLVFAMIKQKARATNLADFSFYPKKTSSTTSQNVNGPKKRQFFQKKPPPIVSPQLGQEHSMSFESESGNSESGSPRGIGQEFYGHFAHTGLKKNNYEYYDDAYDTQANSYPMLSIQTILIVFIAPFLCLCVCLASFVCGWIAKTVASNHGYGFKYNQLSQHQQSEVV